MTESRLGLVDSNRGKEPVNRIGKPWPVAKFAEGKENVDISVGAKVLHKVKGHPHWPAVITSVEGSRVVLQYYGSDEHNVLKHVSQLQTLSLEKVRELCGKVKRKDLTLALKEAGIDVKDL